MIEQLASIQPLVLILMLIGMYSLENVWPYLTRPTNKKRHDTRNFILTLISFATNGVLSLLVLTVLALTTANHWGLLNVVELPGVVEVILGMLLIDFGSYLTHNLQHKVPFLWRFHRVHHSDPHLNASSSLRFHPVDVVVSQCLYQCVAIVVFGISTTAFVLYGTLALPLLVLQHSNVKLPDGLEKYARWVFATPGWHKIHHSSDQRQTDSHYGDVFTFWDRLFGTWYPVQPHEIRYGLAEFAQDDQHKVGYLLASPFKKASPPQPHAS
jgi:sterol desaturase/sphingolipid hydroxylase (fatty acid hydroxylase superfamily)